MQIWNKNYRYIYTPRRTPQPDPALAVAPCAPVSAGRPTCSVPKKRISKPAQPIQFRHPWNHDTEWCMNACGFGHSHAAVLARPAFCMFPWSTRTQLDHATLTRPWATAPPAEALIGLASHQERATVLASPPVEIALWPCIHCSEVGGDAQGHDHQVIGSRRTNKAIACSYENMYVQLRHDLRL
jgi:hypothetical protein